MPYREVDRPLRRDVRRLGRMLGEVIAACEGDEVLDLEEQVRKLAIRRRRGPRGERGRAERELGALLEALPIERCEPLIRAFSLYFRLVNLAEQHHRIRRARAHARDPRGEPQRGSLEAVLRQARDAGVSAGTAREALASLEVVLTLTAHPTEAARRTVLDHLDRIARALEDRDRCRLTPPERERAEQVVRDSISLLWRSDELRREKPAPGDEVKNVLWYLEHVLWDATADVPCALGRAFRRVYGEPLVLARLPVRLHTWVGGDMDGNPNITPDVLLDAGRAYRAHGLRKLLEDVGALGVELSLSALRAPAPEGLRASIAADAARFPDLAHETRTRTEGEPWRRKLRVMELRLEATIAATSRLRRGEEPSHDERERRYAGADELARDLAVVTGALAQVRAPSGRAEALLERVRAQGLAIAELELRVPAADVRAAGRWFSHRAELGDGAARVIGALERVEELQREGGEPACRTLVLSMAESERDVLDAIRCAREAGLWDEARGCARVDVVPLLETLAALDRSAEILGALLADPGYARHVRARGVQEVMLGYSDSGKEVGLLAASAALRRAQERLPSVAAAHGVPLRIFHGRGESVARGGGPAQQAILALPPGSVAGRYKATEQGEALDHKYGRPALAARTLELMLGGALLHGLGAGPHVPDDELPAFAATFDELADVGRRAFRALAWEHPLFEAFFRAATPLEEIGRLPIGSRPAKRAAGGLEQLRAIPWVFAWTQCRAILPGWYGVGSALAAIGRRPGGLAELQAMHARWPFFRAVVDSVAMVLAKTDMRIADRYAALAPDDAREAIWPLVRREHARTTHWIRRVQGTRRLLEDNPALRRSIALRNPYVDPLSLLQVRLLGCRRAGDDRCDRPLLLTLNGIAAGMRNTG